MQLAGCQFKVAPEAEILAVDRLEGTGQVIRRSEPLSVPVVAGLVAITRILYPVPEAVDGIAALIFPELVPTILPITVGLLKLPVELESCAMKLFAGS